MRVLAGARNGAMKLRSALAGLFSDRRGVAALEFALVRSSLRQRAERTPRLGVAPLPYGGTLMFAGRF